MNGLAASRPSATTASVGAPAPPAMSSMTLSVASASTIMIATSSPGLATRDDHVEHGALELLDGRERDPLAVDQRDAHAADGTGERQPGDLGGRRRGVDRQHVVQILGIQAQDGDDDLDLVAQTRDERRAQRPVDQTAGQDRVGGGTALAAEERAGDATRGVHPLFDVDRQREEVEVVLGGLAGGGRRQQHGLVVEVGDDGAGGLLGQPAGLEADGAGAEAPVVDDGGRFEDAVFDFSCRHTCVRPLWFLFSCFASSLVREQPVRTRDNRLTAVDRSGRSSNPFGLRQPLPKTAHRGGSCR